MNNDYTYCIGACEPICNRCKRHVPPTQASTPEQQWWMQPEAKDGNCPNVDYRSCGDCTHFRAQGQCMVQNKVHTFGSCKFSGGEQPMTSTYHPEVRKLITDKACSWFLKRLDKHLERFCEGVKSRTPKERVKYVNMMRRTLDVCEWISLTHTYPKDDKYVLLLCRVSVGSFTVHIARYRDGGWQSTLEMKEEEKPYAWLPFPTLPEEDM